MKTTKLKDHLYKPLPNQYFNFIILLIFLTYYFKFFIKILKKLTNSGNQASDAESMHDTKSISSFNDSSNYPSQNTKEQLLEKDLQLYKERLQSAEEIRSIRKISFCKIFLNSKNLAYFWFKFLRILL